MVTNHPGVWARNQREIADIISYVPEVKEVEPDRFLHLGGLTNVVVTGDGERYFRRITEHGFLYWVDVKKPKKCSFNRKKREYTISDLSYPQLPNRLGDYFKGLLCSSLVGGTTIAAGKLLASEKLVKWDLDTLPPWIIAGVLTIIPAYAFVEVIDAGRRDSSDHQIQELLIDREAWKAYRRSPYGKRFS